MKSLLAVAKSAGVKKVHVLIMNDGATHHAAEASVVEPLRWECFAQATYGRQAVKGNDQTVWRTDKYPVMAVLM